MKRIVTMKRLSMKRLTIKRFQSILTFPRKKEERNQMENFQIKRKQEDLLEKKMGLVKRKLSLLKMKYPTTLREQQYPQLLVFKLWMRMVTKNRILFGMILVSISFLLWRSIRQAQIQKYDTTIRRRAYFTL